MFNLNTYIFLLLTHGDDIMDINIDQVKKEVQKNGGNYLLAIKVITNEPTQKVVANMKKEMKIHNNVIRFIVRDNIIEIMLSNNATLCSYYFTRKEIQDEVVEKLKEYCSQPRPRLLIE